MRGDVARVVLMPTPMPSQEEARVRTDEIKHDLERLVSLANAISNTAQGLDTKIVAASKGAYHKVLGYESWEAYSDEEFGLYMIKLPPPVRKKLGASLREAGMSSHAIAGALGVNDRTVRRDLVEEGVDTTTPVLGSDGKVRPGSRTAASAADQNREEPVDHEEEEVVATETVSGPEPIDEATYDKARKQARRIVKQDRVHARALMEEIANELWETRTHG